MGFNFGNIAKTAINAGIGYVTGGPAGAFVGVQQAQQAQNIEERQKNIIREQTRRQQQMAIGDPTIASRGMQTQQLGFFDRLGNLGSSVGNTLLTGLESAVPSVINRALFGDRPQSAQQQPSVTTVTNLGAAESQGSGSIQAGAGNLLAPLLQAGRTLLKSPSGQLAIGTGAGLAFNQMGSQGSSVRITRKMKADARMVLRMTGGNIQQAADMLGVDQDFFIFVLLKRFRNDGPVVTKAALRKTKQTIRRLHSMQDVLKSITPTATMRRRTPMKRASTTTLIKN
jgi:hypothetical protein